MTDADQFRSAVELILAIAEGDEACYRLIAERHDPSELVDVLAGIAEGIVRLHCAAILALTGEHLDAGEMLRAVLAEDRAAR